MGQLRDVLRSHWALGLNDVSSGTRASFKGWLCNKNYVVSSYDPASFKFEIYTPAPQSLISSIAHDVDRFTSASFETAAGINGGVELANARAWPLIRAYYAAFFAAHSLSRIFGRSLSTLGRDETSALRATALQSGLPNFIAHEKLYVFSVSADGRTIQAAPFDGGPHLDTWKQLRALLRDLQIRILGTSTPSLQAQEVCGFLSNLNDLLAHQNANGSFLSKVRNGINYRQDYGAWHPVGDGPHWAEVDRCLRAICHDPLHGMQEPMTKPISRFANGCSMVIGMNAEMVRELVERHPENRSFLQPRSTLLLEAVANMRSAR